MSKQLKAERCWNCDDLTGRAGRADDSLYDALDHGPYCPECWNTLCEAVEEDYARLQAIVDTLAPRVESFAAVCKAMLEEMDANSPDEVCWCDDLHCICEPCIARGLMKDHEDERSEALEAKP